MPRINQNPDFGDFPLLKTFALLFCLALSTPVIRAQSLTLSANPVPRPYPVAVSYSSSLLQPVTAEPAVAEPDLLPAAPEPAAYDHYDRNHAAPSASWRQKPFSRVGIGADVTPLGIGLKAAIILNHYFDARLNGAYFNYNTANVLVTGASNKDQFIFAGDIHLASLNAALDWYPFGNVWRISPGVMLYNANQISINGTLGSGTSFSFNSQTYYSANANPVTGATPLTANATIGLHSRQPSLTLTTGWGKFMPHSERHWSFPFEVGAIYTGPPAIDLTMGGWACTDAKQTSCANIGNQTTTIGQQFNADLQSKLTSWRNSAKSFPIYPILSYGVMYSFDIR